MPSPGFAIHQQTAIESNLPVVGTLFTDMYYTIPPAGGYGGTVFGTVTGSVIGAVVTLNKIGIIDQVGIVGFSELTGSINSARVIGWGKGLGSLVGTQSGATIIADTNTVFVELLIVGTIAAGAGMPPKDLIPGTTTKGTIQFVVRGV